MINFEVFKEFLLNLIKDYGYFGIFLAGFSEPIFQPFPTEIFIVSGILLGLDWVLVLIVSTVACNVGAAITYYLAKNYGEWLMLKLFDEEKIRKGTIHFKKWGVLGIIIASFTPIPFEVICWICGSFEMPFERYMFAVFLSRLIRHGMVILPFALKNHIILINT
ncbi:YqaA family protein [Methanocaldococcus fervens]|uniref:SNARE associated Golgi protein n=1 Tax=Methanocaldococcus fervens (strain DSM 4213 / JCM 15782 / AG86) TaxID=573064 RepID=C7P6X1_METFA|nr:YqaA family protein [Methanocaldococcus fervens]ACV24303.1 SNARE associated Golgi protein [Methanocaldococcus fervens AG86]